VATPGLVIELQEQLLARERESDSREGTVAMYEDGLLAFERALGMVCMDHDAKHIWAKATQQDFLARTCTSTSRSK
jgi:hypothetical protein